MRKATLLLLIFILTMASIFMLTSNNAYAASPLQIQVDKIDHVVTPIYGGILLINDTIKISPTENTIFENFSIGFPLKYRANLYHSMAYTAGVPDDRFDVIFDTGLGVVGYYGVTVVFPNGGITLNANQSYNFTVVFVLSDLIQSSATQMFTFDFPLYPSLTHEVSICNVTAILPKTTNQTDSDFPFDATQKSDGYYLNYTKTNLPKLTRVSTKISFSTQGKDDFICFSVKKLNREITLEEQGYISSSDLFVLESKTAFTFTNINLPLPINSRNVAAFNEQGTALTVTSLENDTYKIPLILAENQSRSLKLVYMLDREIHIVQQDTQSYNLNLNISENFQIIPATFILKIVFPEGALIESFPQETFSFQKDVFQEKLSLSYSNTVWLQNEQWSFAYSYTVFWASFRPTLWATALVIIGSIIAFAWQRPKAPVPVSIVLVPRRMLNEFVEAYEEKKRILSELEQIKRKAQKGRVSRRRYKVRKNTLENRLSALSRRIADLGQKIMSGGAKYSDAMRQLEVAETEIDNIEADIKRIEVRFKRGEISAQTYRQLLEDDLRRRERAKTTIDGLLLRLTE